MILKQADAGVPIKDICRQAGIGTPMYYQWKSKYGGMQAPDLKRVKELEAENSKLERMYAELALDNAAIKGHIEVNTSITSQRLVRIFERLQCDHGLPQVLRTDNGPEFLGEAFVQWAKAHGMAIQYIQPGKPNQNAYVERFNRTFREELLDQHLFLRLKDVREAVYRWMIEYNGQRPHDSLGDLTPLEHRQQTAGSSTFEVSA